MLPKRILRVLHVELQHFVIPAHFRKHRGSGDRSGLCVALYDRHLIAHADVRLLVAVYEQHVRRNRKLLDCAAHGKKSRVENIDLVDLAFTGVADAVCERLFKDHGEKRFPLFFGELFGIVKPRDLRIGRKNNGGGANRPCQRAPARLVYPAYCAAALKQGTIEAAKESERGIVDIETLQQTNRSLIETLDEVVQIQKDGRQKRAEAEAELGRIEGELKAKLLEVAR